MQTSNLYKVEMHRFFLSFLLFALMAVVFLAILFLASDDSDVLLGDSTAIGALQSVMKIASLLTVFIASVVISNYVGREFKQKTINYEVMRGYSLWKICFAKTITCGLCFSVMLLVSILLFLMKVPGTLQTYTSIHILFMFLVLCHICSCTTLYVMLCRNGAAGGCLAFARFTLLEVVVFFILELFASDSICNGCKVLLIMGQWSAVNSTDGMMPTAYMTGIIASAILEYLFLLVMIQISSKKIDF